MAKAPSAWGPAATSYVPLGSARAEATQGALSSQAGQRRRKALETQPSAQETRGGRSTRPARISSCHLSLPAPRILAPPTKKGSKVGE